MIKVAIVDDHPIVVDGMKQFIGEQPDMTIVGTAMNGAECAALLKVASPDVMLLDIQLPDASGIDICLSVTANYPAVSVIALTGFRESIYIKKMTDNGAKGYLMKNALPQEIAEAIRTVYNGGTYFTEETSAVMKQRREGGKLYLTNREKELLSLIVEGYTNREISEKLFLSVATVNSYRKTLLLKLGVKNTAAMVKLAITEMLV